MSAPGDAERRLITTRVILQHPVRYSQCCLSILPPPLLLTVLYLSRFLVFLILSLTHTHTRAQTHNMGGGNGSGLKMWEEIRLRDLPHGLLYLDESQKIRQISIISVPVYRVSSTGLFGV